MLGRIGKQATPALPAIRRLRESVAGMFSDKPTRDTVEMFNRETHRATREAEAAITGKPVDLPEPKTSSTKPSPAPKVAGTNFYFKAKTWDEWMEVLRHEQSPEGLTDAVTAIASLGRKAKQKESVQALLWLIDERAPWRKPRSKHYVTLNVEMQLATRALLSAETVPLFNEALKNGPSKRRQFLIDTLRHGPASDRFPPAQAACRARAFPESAAGRRGGLAR